jgi:hypothetical protein
MSGRFCPVKHGYRADFDADSVAVAGVPVNSNVCAMYAQLLWWFDWSPDVVTFVLTNDFAVLLKIGIYRQDISPTDKSKG